MKQELRPRDLDLLESQMEMEASSKLILFIYITYIFPISMYKFMYVRALNECSLLAVHMCIYFDRYILASREADRELDARTTLEAGI